MTETIITGLYEHGHYVAAGVVFTVAAWALYRDLSSDWRADDPRPEVRK